MKIKTSILLKTEFCFLRKDTAFLGLILLFFIKGTIPLCAQTFPSGFSQVAVANIYYPTSMAFAPDGRLWELEHGPSGGDELNLIRRGENYGWPLVSYGNNYNGVPIPKPDTRPELAKPVIYWVPVIAPGNIMFYKGKLFPQWQGSALISGLGSTAILRITFDGAGGATATQRWSIGKRIRDIEEAPDGSLWMVEDASPGGLYHLTPKI